ncbi:hypothetical protein McanMca71_007620 [Microsporum canis]
MHSSLSSIFYDLSVARNVWTPFGDTDLEDTDVSIHSYVNNFRCRLTYVRWKWASEDGKPIHHTYDKGLTPTFPEPPQELPHIPISYKAFDLEEESASEDATRNLFCWLWLEGYPGNEKEVYSHEWFDLGDSGEADEEALCGNSELSYCSRCRSLGRPQRLLISCES